jgi:succinate dehydrogenase / fumarate reductase, cytochrome b subunit
MASTIEPSSDASIAPAKLFLGSLLSVYNSPIGKKLLTGFTGLGLATFVLMHMLGNLILFFSADAYNQYGHFIERLGPLTALIELTLLLLVLLHAAAGIAIFLNRQQARPMPYQQYQSAGPPSYQSLSSRTMIFTGSILACFIGWHLFTFKFGPRYLTADASDPTAIRDLASLVFEVFQDPWYTTFYLAVMLLLGLHLRHGLWSALQSLGATHKTLRPLLYILSLLLAIAIALGFLILPLAIYTHLLP